MNLGISPTPDSPSTVLSGSREFGITNAKEELARSSTTSRTRNRDHSASGSKTPRSANMNLKENLLPPNTGPPGSVSSSSTSSNKNLSHVPCKFFKQGICQAGNSCPFSHNLDGTLGADKLPCKYFQKGNCKFGLKCALAHFLPDGTRVNSKSLLVRENRRSYNHGQNLASHAQGHNLNSLNVSQSQGYLAGQSNNQSFQNSQNGFKIPQTVQSAPASQNTFTSLGGYSQFKNYTPPNSKPIDITFERSPENIETSPSLGSHSSGFSGHYRNSYTSNDPLGLVPNNFGGIVLSKPPQAPSSYSGGATNTNAFQPANSGQTLFRSYSTNTSPVALNGSAAYSNFYGSNSQFYVTPSSASSNGNSKFAFASKLPTSSGSVPSQNPFSSSYYYNNLDTSAIVDDDDLHHRSPSNGDVFEEDYVPGSLSDLILTPQELSRRDSRSQSGTLLLRPNLLSLLNGTRDDDDSQHQHLALPYPNGAFRKNSMEVGIHDDVFLME